MFCFNCGKELPDGVKFCPHCGTKMAAAPEPAPPKPPKAKERREPKQREPGKKRRALPILGGILAVLVVFALGVFLYGKLNTAQFLSPLAFWGMDESDLSDSYYGRGFNYERLCVPGYRELDSLDEYAAALDACEDFSLTPPEDDDLCREYRFFYVGKKLVGDLNGAENFRITIYYVEDETVIMWEWGRGLEPTDDGRRGAMTPQQFPRTEVEPELYGKGDASSGEEPGPTPEPTVTIPDTGFQDPLAYFGLTGDDLFENQHFTDPPHSQRSFSVELQERDCLEDYVAYLTSGKFNLELLKKKEQDSIKYSAHYFISYCLAYTGDQEIGVFAKHPDDSPGQIEIGAAFYYDQGRTSISWNWADGMEPVDAGARFDGTVVLSGGGGSSGGGSSSGGSSGSGIDTAQGVCPYCDIMGQMTCPSCHGSKGKYVTDRSAPNYSGSTSGPKTTQKWEDCKKCYGKGKITCTHCGGSHKYTR